MEPTPLVRFDELKCQDGIAGVVTLNNPKPLNALTLEMFKAIHEKLKLWKARDEVRLLFFHSVSDKAFCSGGDVKTLALKVMENSDTDFVEQFFWWEYSTDLLVRDFPKPVVCWLDGIVMGGGMGISNGASHRIVTEKSVFAMPELNIGFFPDVGAAFFLNQLPETVALFLAWTGARLNSSDALQLKIADHSMHSKMKEGLLDIIAQTEWSKTSEENHFRLSNILAGEEVEMEPGKLALAHEAIQNDFRASTLEEALIKYLGSTTTDPWISANLANFRKSSPLSAHVTYQHLKRMRGLPCDAVLTKDWSLAVKLVKQGDFKEGIRSVLIDKTHDPKWKHKSFGHVTQLEVKSLLEPHPGEEKFRQFLTT